MSTDRWRYRTGGLVCVAKLGSEHMASIALTRGNCNANLVYGDSPQAIRIPAKAVKRVRQIARRSNCVDITGGRFGRLVVVSETDYVLYANPLWHCRCDCGSEVLIAGGKLRSGDTRSCGCLQQENRRRVHLTHGQSRRRDGYRVTGAYRSWCSMRRRCLRPSDAAWPDYGGRGITVCERWREDFEAFFADMGERPVGMSLDRIDNDGSYSPENCRWATQRQQSRNTRMNHLLTANGVTMCITAWADALGVTLSALQKRVKRLPPDRVLTDPFIRRMKKPGAKVMA